MIDGLKPYPEYQESEVDWIGRLPVAWQLRRAKFLFREIDERSRSGREELLSVSHKTGVTPRSQKNVTMFLAESNVGHKICRPQDLVINTLWAWMAALGISKHTGIVSPAYGVYRPIAPTTLLPSFAHQLLRTPLYAGEYQRRSSGVNSSRLRLYPEDFFRIPVLLPPPDQQAAIVRFLDHANRNLDGFVRAKRRELALISEMLMTTTERSLTLDGTRTVRLAAAVEVTSRPIDRHDGENYTRIGLYNRGRGIFHKSATCGAELGDSDFFWVKEGDLVISGQFAWEGAVALARATDSGCIVSHRYPVLRGRQDYLSSAVLCALLRTKFGALLLNHHSRGAAGRNRPLNASTFLKEKIPIPPISAQARIAELVDREYSVSQSVARTIQLLNEYRTRLTADIVTGKLDVREAAARLPELPAEAAAESSADDEMDDTETEELEA